MTFGWSLYQAGAVRKRREVTLSLLLALKLQTDRADGTSPGIPSATATASQRRRSHGAMREAEPGSPLASSSSALLHNPVLLTAFLANQTGIKIRSWFYCTV